MEKLKQNYDQRSLDLTPEQRLFDNLHNESNPSRLRPPVWSLTKYNAMVTWLDDKDSGDSGGGIYIIITSLLYKLTLTQKTTRL